VSRRTDAVALAIALALDANSQETPRPAPGMFADAPPEEPEHTVQPKWAPILDVSVTALAAVGMLPRVAPGIAIGIDRRWTQSFESHVSVFGVSEANHEDFGPPSTWVTTSLVAATLDACTGHTVEPARLRACVGGAYGLVASGYGLGPIRPVGWAGLNARLDARIPLTPWLTFAPSVDGFATLVHPNRRVEAEDGSLVWTLGPLPSYGVAAGLGLAFGL
jgi:hypothetical protein